MMEELNEEKHKYLRIKEMDNIKVTEMKEMDVRKHKGLILK